MGNRKEHDEKTVREATSLKKETVPKRVVGSKIAKTLLTLVSYIFSGNYISLEERMDS